MKKITLIFAFVVLLSAINAYGYTCGNGITYTSSNPWVSANGTVTADGGTRNNDWVRLHWMLKNCLGKIVFDEGDYYLGVPPSGQAPTNSNPPSLPLFSYRIIEGTGRRSAYAPSYITSRIIQTVPGEEIFTIGPGTNVVSVRDLALVGTPMTSETYPRPDGTIGILAYSDCLFNCSSTGFQFSNLTFTNLAKGIYVNADDPPTIPNNQTTAHQWQFDNVRLDHAIFENCTIGVHINSYNSGWSISSLDFLIPPGAEQGDSTSITGKTYGIYLERSAYTSMDMLIGNGPDGTGPGYATALIYVKEHGNLNIQSTIAEDFHDDIIVHGNTRNAPINLMNNVFLNGVRVKNATIYSSANQFFSAFVDTNGDGTPDSPYQAAAVAQDYAQIYSLGDKFCSEGDTNCDEGRSYELAVDPGTTNVTSRIIFSTNQGKNLTTVPTTILRDVYDSTPNLSILAPTNSSGSLLRIGRGAFWYDITRVEGSTNPGYLEFQGNQNGYGGYLFKTQGGTVAVNYDGSVTYGSVAYTSLGSSTDGTVVYCSNCTKSSPCSSGGSGALAKRLGGSWDCD